MRKSSGDDSMPLSSLSTPGASPMTRVSARCMALTSSPVEPLRSTMAVSSSAPWVIAARNPAAIDSTPIKTATTPAMPTAEATTDPVR